MTPHPVTPDPVTPGPLTPGLVTLDLGDRTEPPPTRRPAASGPDPRTLRRAAVAVAAGVLVLAVAAPQPRALPTVDEVRVRLAPGPRVSGALDTLAAQDTPALDTVLLTAQVTNDAPFPVAVRAVRLSSDPLAGVLGDPLTVPAAGTAALALMARPDCTGRGTETLQLTLAAAGGTRRVDVPVRTLEAYAGLCPPAEPGLHAAVTGARPDATGTQVQVRVVNRGSVPLGVGLPGTVLQRRSRSVIESGTGPTVAGQGGAPPSPAPAIVSFPALPVLLEPAAAVVLTLRPVADPCAPDPAALTLHARDPDAPRRGRPPRAQPSVPVEGADRVTAALVAAAGVRCAQRAP